MSADQEEFRIPSLSAIKKLLDPIYSRLDKIDMSIKIPSKESTQRFYRNEDLKRIFGLSNNTIIKYRENGIIPFTKLGDIYLYDANKIEQILKDNQV